MKQKKYMKKLRDVGEIQKKDKLFTLLAQMTDVCYNKQVGLAPWSSGQDASLSRWNQGFDSPWSHWKKSRDP